MHVWLLKKLERTQRLIATVHKISDDKQSIDAPIKAGNSHGGDDQIECTMNVPHNPVAPLCVGRQTPNERRAHLVQHKS